jgi:hypothetical protein
MAANKKTVFIPFGTFDKSKCSLTDAFIAKFKNGNETCNSSIRYLMDDGTYSDDVRIELQPRKIGGIYPSYPFGMDKAEQSPETVTGYQFTYMLTSQETINEPTKDEQYAIDIFEFIGELMWEKLCEEYEKDDESVIPPSSKNCYLGATAKKGHTNKSYAVKPIFEYPNKPIDEKSKNKKREKDTTQPMRIYMKLNCFGKGKDLKCFTKIYGPGNKLVSPARYNKTPCTVHPVIQLKKVFWGSHGKNTHGVSLNMHVSEMNIVPLSREGQRFLAPNSAPEEEDDEQSFFHNPVGNSQSETNAYKEIDFSEDSKNLIEDLEHSEEEEEEKPKKKIVKKSSSSKSSGSSKKKHRAEE